MTQTSTTYFAILRENATNFSLSTIRAASSSQTHALVGSGAVASRALHHRDEPITSDKLYTSKQLVVSDRP